MRVLGMGAFQATLDRVMACDRFKRWLIPLARAYVRYAPFRAGKRAFWSQVVNPYLAWEPYPFVAQTRFGSRMAGNTRQIQGQYIYYFGLWEPHISRWMIDRLCPGDTFIDVGAHIGYYSLLASRRVGPAGRVVAIEPSPGNFRLLQSNLARNRARNVRAVRLAVADGRGMVPLYRGPETDHGRTTIIAQEAARAACAFECEVETASLDGILRPDEAAGARLIKIDVEGAEWSVVAGMRSLLARARADLEVTVEVDPGRLAHQGKGVADVIEVFAQAGFQAYRLENDYRAESFLEASGFRGPRPLTFPVECETDMLFSRQGVNGFSRE